MIASLQLFSEYCSNIAYEAIWIGFNLLRALLLITVSIFIRGKTWMPGQKGD
jgi:hypothetical protein